MDDDLVAPDAPTRAIVGFAPIREEPPEKLMQFGDHGNESPMTHVAKTIAISEVAMMILLISSPANEAADMEKDVESDGIRRHQKDGVPS